MELTTTSSNNGFWENTVQDLIKQNKVIDAKIKLIEVLSSQEAPVKALLYLAQLIYEDIHPGVKVSLEEVKTLKFFLELIERLTNLKRFDEALILTEKSIIFFNDNQQLMYAKAVILRLMGRPQDSLNAFKHLIALAPSHEPGRSEYINLLIQFGMLGETVPLLAEKLSENDDIEIRRLLVRFAFSSGQLAIAEREAYALIDQGYSDLPYMVLASINYNRGNLGKTKEFFQAYIEKGEFSDLEIALQMRNTGVRICDFQGIEKLPDPLDILSSISSKAIIANSICQLSVRSLSDTSSGLSKYLNIQNRLGNMIHQEAMAQPFRINVERFFPAGKNKNLKQLRYGFLSVLSIPKLGEILAPFFNALRAKDNVVIFYNVSANKDDQLKVSESLNGVVDEFVAIESLSDRDTAKRIAMDSLDVLIDLNGLQQPNSRVGAFAWRIAPLQLIWAGIPTPCLFDDVDGQILDPYLVNKEQQGPAPLVLPKVWTCTSAMPDLDYSRTGEDKLVFSIMMSADKIRPAQIAIWAEILKREPRAYLLFGRSEFSNEVIKQGLIEIFVRHDISSERLLFVEQKTESHLELYQMVDVNLDAFPVHSGITIIEAAWMGVPTVVLCGKAIHQRIGVSVLNNLRIPKGIVYSPEEYIDVAIDLVKNANQSRREKIRQYTKDSAFLDMAGFAFDFNTSIRNALAFKKV